MKLTALVGVAILSIASIGEAATVRMDYGSISAITLETFEDASPGFLASPAFFNGFTFTTERGPSDAGPPGPNDPTIEDDPTFCGWETRCLASRFLGGAREIGSFNPGTTALGLRWWTIQESDLFEVVVTGGSGVSTFHLSGPQSLAFFDSAGLLSVRFANQGTQKGGGALSRGNYSFDDVVTGDLAPIPAPPSLILLLGALLAGRLVLHRRAPPT